jgi:hypothetical protein
MAGAEFFLNPPRESKTHQVAQTDFAMWYHRCQCLTSLIHEIAEKTNPQKHIITVVQTQVASTALNENL